MEVSVTDLPRPDPEAARLSERLLGRLRDAICSAGGAISFEDYMRRVLYEPGLGYYSAGSIKLGPSGDFVTAPELHSFFGRVLARHLDPLLQGIAEPVIVEFGAGSGRLAFDVLTRLAESGRVPAYWIVEPSADLRSRQQALLAGFGTRIRWLEHWPAEGFDGVIVANEVLDALPVRCFVKRDGAVRERCVGWRQERLAWVERPPPAELATAVETIERELGRSLPDGFRSEVCLTLPAWVAAAAEPLGRGGMLLIDYGSVRREYYHPSRNAGTLSCHYRHRAHGDPLLLPGLQDVSAWVDFSACAASAAAAGLDVTGFTTQAHFLLERGAEEWLTDVDPRRAIEQAQAVKTLILPGEMGERFKLLQLTRGPGAVSLPGRDFRARL